MKPDFIPPALYRNFSTTEPIRRVGEFTVGEDAGVPNLGRKPLNLCTDCR
jgi:hypothetical protein